MITLMEMLRDKKVDPAAGRPLSLTKVYMANVMARREAVLLAKIQKRDAAIARRQREKDLYEEIAKLAKGEEPKGEEQSRRYAKGVPTAAGQLGQQAIGFPPLEGGNGDGGGVPEAKNT